MTMNVVNHPAKDLADVLGTAAEACATAEVLIEMAVMGTPDPAARVQHFDRLQATLDEWRRLVDLARQEIRS